MTFLHTNKVAVVLAGLAIAASLVVGFPAKAAKAKAGALARRVCDRTTGPGGRGVEQLVNRLRAGQVGCLRGTFDGDVAIDRGGMPGRPITLRNIPGTRATIVGSFYVGPAANDVVVRGLRLDGRGGASPQVNGDRVVFRDNEITNGHRGICFLLGADFESGSAWRARNVVIDHNRIHDCGRLPATGHDHGIYVEGANGVRITNNLI